MQKYHELIKNSAAFKLLDEGAHAQLICGKDSAASLALARVFVLSMVGKTSHPDTAEFPPEDRKKILVEDIDELTSTSLLTPIELKYKYYIIKNGETMNDAASNKLLKTLEEPPPAVRILILCPDENSVLATIRSRCRIINIEPFSQSALNNIIDNYYQDSPYTHIAKELHLGSIERLEKAISGYYEPIINLVYNVLLYMKKSSQILVHAGRMLEHKDNMADIIEFFELILHDCMMYSLSQPLILAHRRSDTAALASFYSLDTILRLKDTLTRAKVRQENYGNINSIIDELLFSLLEIRQKCQS